MPDKPLPPGDDAGDRDDEQHEPNGETEQPDSTGGPAGPEEPGVGFVLDYITQQSVRATPEETEAVQVFARRLVEEFGYPRENITTKPQFRVRARPSGARKRGYPVDIAVFSNPRKLEDDAFILVECKRKTRKDGEKQLKLYLTMSAAQIGVWFNGSDHLYLHKTYLPDGTLDWEYLPTIPKFGQSIADIGSMRRDQLSLPTNLKSIFNDIRNHLAGNTVGITLDQALAQEIMAILFCKIADELGTAPHDLPTFRASVADDSAVVARRVRDLFKRVKTEYADVFEPNEEIRLDAESLRYVVGELQNYELIGAPRDAIGEAFEVFIGPAVRGEEGQFFTPRNVVQMMVQLLDPEPGEMIVDPACGSGGFLIVALEHVWKKLEEEAREKNWSPAILERRRRDLATRTIRGIDKDSFLTKVTKAYMAIIGDGRSGIYCDDSLNEPEHWLSSTKAGVKLGSFNVVLTNPPFGSKIKVTGEHKLSQYDLAHRWKKPTKTRKTWEKTDSVRRDQPPQILFIERCIQLLRTGGRLAIVLPESLFGMPKYGYIVQFLADRFTMRAFVSLPEEVFQPSTHAKTCVVVLEKKTPAEDYEIEMAIADWCGHDSRGNPTNRVNEAGEAVLLDDLPKIAAELSPRLKWKAR